MKKFCSSCGNQLELSRRTCSECGAANPFFVARFSLLEDQTGELEKLRLEKEKIERQIAEREAAQEEFKRQEQLKKARFPAAPDWNNELLLLRKEIELYRHETVQLLNQLRNELIEKIQDENGRGRTASESTVKSQAAVVKSNTAQNYHEPQSSGKSLARNMVVILVFLFVIGVGGPGVYFYFNKATERKHEMLLPLLQQPNYISHQNVNDSPDDKATGENSETHPANVMAEVSAKPATGAAEKFDLTVTRAMDDLIGQRLSGCDMVVRSVSEINNISQPVFVGKLSSGYLKYKFDVTITRNNETHTSSPFIYYTSDGRFVSIDGANCK